MEEDKKGVEGAGGRAGMTAEEEDEIYTAWKPMVSDFESIQNLMGMDVEKAGFHSAINLPQRIPLSKTPCKFPYKQGKRCWKGWNCPYMHDLVASKATYGELGKERCQSSAVLEKRSPLTIGSMMRAKISHFESPSDFHVILQDTKCLCESVLAPKNKSLVPFEQTIEGRQALEELEDQIDQDELILNELCKEKGEGLDAFETLVSKMNARFKDEDNCIRNSIYQPSELVAVWVMKAKLSEGAYWTRGEIIESDIFNATERTLPYFKIRLIDVGSISNYSAKSICRLPHAFCLLPPLAIKCSLFGIVPVRYTWNRSINESLLSRLEGKIVLLKIRVPPKYDLKYTEDEEVKVPPYLIDLLLEEEKGLPLINIREEFIAEGKGLGLNPIPYRPVLNNLMDKLIKDQMLPTQPYPLSKNTIFREEKRLNKMVSIAAQGLQDDKQD